MRELTVAIGEELDGLRLDKALGIALAEEGLSRSAVQNLCQDGGVRVNGKPGGKSTLVKQGDLLTVALERYNNGRMKRYLCELFLQQDLDTLRRIMARAEALEGADSKELGRAFQALVGEMLES